MKSTIKKMILTSVARRAVIAALLAGATVMQAQAPKPFQGTITAISGSTLSVKTDSDGVQQVEVPSSAVLLRIAPGAKDLSAAEKIAFSDLAVGDRALIRPDPNGSGPALQALRIVAIKQSDLALKQQKDREDWQRRGVGGLVKSVDPASGVIVVGSGAGATAKTVTVHTSKTTILKRYAQSSVSYDEAVPGPIDAIHVGDQLRARGEKNADGTEVAAEEVISGSFLNIAGTITSLDAAGSTLVVKDLATKKQATIHITSESQMRRLPDRMATMLAMRLKGATSSGQGASSGSTPSANGAWAGGQHSGGGQWGSASGQAPDPQQLLSRAPAIQLNDLQKGEAVMLVATDGASQITAITLLAGVEPLLEAPAASQNLLSNWSMNGGASAAEAATQ
ncbi:MAG: DUF5666 domain-containing protein [Terracidiphilus sp.]